VIYAIVLYTKIVPVQGLKLIVAIVVALAIASPTIKEWIAFQKKKADSRKGGR
jgi:putative ABC transport system permease protein